MKTVDILRAAWRNPVARLTVAMTLYALANSIADWVAA